ncbi:MAG: DNA cytosine methyltransferase [Terriglobia bacterium]
MKRFTCVDLFCGCGGFALGMERAGFEFTHP